MVSSFHCNHHILPHLAAIDDGSGVVPVLRQPCLGCAISVIFFDEADSRASLGTSSSHASIALSDDAGLPLVCIPPPPCVRCSRQHPSSAHHRQRYSRSTCSTRFTASYGGFIIASVVSVLRAVCCCRCRFTSRCARRRHLNSFLCSLRSDASRFLSFRRTFLEGQHIGIGGGCVYRCNQHVTSRFITSSSCARFWATTACLLSG